MTITATTAAPRGTSLNHATVLMQGKYVNHPATAVLPRGFHHQHPATVVAPDGYQVQHAGTVVEPTEPVGAGASTVSSSS